MSDDVETTLYLRERRRRRNHTVFSLGLLLAAILIVLLWHRVVISVRSGEAGVLFRWFTGTEMNEIYGEGLHVIWPWNTMYIYDLRLQTEFREFKLLAKTGLPVTLEVAIRYRPDARMLPNLHVNIGPDYLERIVMPETEAVLRRAVGRYEPEEIYTGKRGFLESIVVDSFANVQNRYVVVDDVLVRSIGLPQPVRDAIEQKSVLMEQQKSFVFRIEIEQREAERKAIEARGIQAYQDTIKQSLTPDLLRWQGILATRELAASNNTKMVVIGSGKDGMPLILGNDR